jgi:hypothetical protein
MKTIGEALAIRRIFFGETQERPIKTIGETLAKLIKLHREPLTGKKLNLESRGIKLSILLRYSKNLR